MVRDSLIAGSRLQHRLLPGSHGADENAPLQSNGALSTTAQSGRLLSPNKGDDRVSVLTISRISINAQLSSLNLAQVDPADLPPPLVIDKQNRLVTDPRSARSLSTDDYENYEQSSDGTTTPTPKQRKASTASKTSQDSNDDVSANEPMSVLTQTMETPDNKTPKRNSKSNRNSGAKLVEQNYLKVVHGTKTTRNVYKRDNEGHWELIGKGDPRIDEAYDAAERARKRARKRESLELRAQAKAVVKAAAEEQKKQKKEAERQARANHMAAKGVEDDPWALMTTGLPRKPKAKDAETPKTPPNSSYPLPPLRPPPEVPQSESYVPAATTDLDLKKHGRKDSELDKTRAVQDLVSVNHDFLDLALSMYEKDENGKFGLVSVPRNRPSSGGRFLSRNQSATDTIAHEAAPHALTLPSRVSHQRGRHQSLWINGEELPTPSSLDLLKLHEVGFPNESLEATITPPSTQGSTSRLWLDLSSKSRDSSSKDKRFGAKGSKGDRDCLSSFTGSDPLEDENEEPDKEYTAEEEITRRQNFPAFKNYELRKQVGCETHVHAPGMGPKHRNHERVWHSKNLWCAGPGCKGACHCCGRPCCAHFENMQLMADRGDMNSKVKVREIIGAIQLWEGSARENGTFMECTECHKFTCPFCCGICPIPMCEDLQCIKCTDNPWGACDWHDVGDLKIMKQLLLRGSLSKDRIDRHGSLIDNATTI